MINEHQIDLPTSEPRRVTHLVVIARDGHPEVFEFGSFQLAADFFDRASEQWSESYLALVVAGPGRPLNRSVDPHCRPDVVAMRSAPGAGCCIDEDCDLSGGFAHVGPCEPCGCPLHHAIAECHVRMDVEKYCAGGAEKDGTKP